MLYLPTLISVIEVVLVVVPALLTVAFVTVAERKTMASMQRRLGPNIVGQITNVHNNSIKYIPIKKSYSYTVPYSMHRVSHKQGKFNQVRSYTVTLRVQQNNNQIINSLYDNRKAPVKPFTGDVIYTCDNLLSPISLNELFKGIKGLGGIYMFTYKHDHNIYYIGRTNNFKNRVSSHMESNLSDRFHVFARAVGWDQLTFSIVEICSLSKQGEKEDKYLQNYLPILNTILKSNLGDIQSYDSLYDKLKVMKSNLGTDNKYKGVSVYNYKCVGGQISLYYSNFSSISKLAQHLGVSRGTVSVYLNTYVPFKDNLFFTDIIKDIDIVQKLVSDATQGLKLNHNLAVKVWMYFVKKDGTIDITTYESIGAVSKILGAHHTHISKFHLDKWVKGGFKSNYLFSYELSEKDLDKLKDFSLLRKNRNLNIWAYNASSLELISPVFNSAHKAAEFFNVDYRSILSHMDTYKPTVKKGELVLLFNSELSELDKKSLTEKFKLWINESTLLWVYKKVNNLFKPINDNIPDYVYKLKPNLQVNINNIRKYTDSGKSYKGLYFYTSELKK